MKTAVFFVACVPMLLTGVLLLNDRGPVNVESNSVSTERTPGYGDISGQILFDGDVPQPKLIVRQNDSRVKDSAICAADDLMANDLLVDPTTKGIANAFVYIYPRNIKRHGIKIHPDLIDLGEEEKEIVFYQRNCRFVPHAMVVRIGQKVRVKSEDRCAHNAHLSTIYNTEFSSIIGPRDGQDVVIDHLNRSEVLPMPVRCDIHPWMKAHWLIIDHPYAAVTDEEGRFTINNLPVGEIEFRIWHERAGYIDRRYVVTVTEGRTELEPVIVPAPRFDR